MLLKLLLVAQAVVGLVLAECDCDKRDFCTNGCAHIIHPRKLPEVVSIEGDASAERILKELPSTDVPFMRKSCERGCKFFNLVDQSGENEPVKNLNGSVGDCLAMCDEEYNDQHQPRMGCRLGCRLRIHHLEDAEDQRTQSSSRSEGTQLRLERPMLVFALRLLDDQGFPKMIFMANKHEADADLGEAREISSSWWPDAFGLTGTFFKDNAETSDYGVVPENEDESEKPKSLPGSDWLRCASRHTGIPGWLLALAIAAAALSALWLCLAPEKSADSIEKVTLVNPDTTTKLTVYLPDEAPLHKKPPPKYHEVVDIDDPTIQV